MSTMTALELFTNTVDYDPGLATLRQGATCELQGPHRVRVRAGDHDIQAEDPEPIGGTGMAPSPLELALGALASSLAVTYRAHAEREGIALDQVRIEAAGELSLTGQLGFEEQTPGLDDVELRVTLIGPEEPEAYAALRRRVDRADPLLNAIGGTTSTRTLLRIDPSPMQEVDAAPQLVTT